MKSLKCKASRFFRDSPSQDEKAANAEPASGSEIEFDAGIQGHSLKKKPSRFFLRKNDKLDKPLPAPPSNASSSTSGLLSPTVGEGHSDQPQKEALRQDEASTLEKPLPLPPAPHDFADSLHVRSTSAADSVRSLLSPSETDPPQVKSRPSFAALRSKSSRLFRHNDSAEHPPPPPPIPQIPVEPPAPKPHRPALAPIHSAWDSRSSPTSSQGRSISISRPMLISHICNSSIPEHPVTVPFTKPANDLPARPSRPESLDEETLAFMREGGTRMVLPTSNRVSASTASCSTPRSQASSIEARLGFPSGNGTPRSYSIESPLAACFPHDPSQPLAVRDSTGSIRGYSRFSEYIHSQQGKHALDGVDTEDRDLGPIEQYRAGKEGDWTLEKRVSKGIGGSPGMLFRTRWGGFHFVADI